MSTILCRNLCQAVLAVIVCVLPAAVSAGEPARQAVLWNEGTKQGQWFAFGPGLLDSAKLSGENGQRLIVDWRQTVWGVGSKYGADPKIVGAKPLPKLGPFHKIQLEARTENEGNVKLTIELIVQRTDRAKRARDDDAKSLTASWQKLEFDLPGDFPGVDAAVLAEVDAIRVLFLDADKSGEGAVEFRNVTLLP